ncbi:MAG TPA: FAD-dependent oxidoreductase [Microvirga sp.]|nr:FAD-dependent oxidoreductase [Microvirga sp.]
MGEVLTPDLCVVGAGAAGLSVAAVAASLGASVVLVERDRMGGECLNAGCVPSKALAAAGRRQASIRGAQRFGIRVEADPVADFAAVGAHVRGVVAAIAPNDSPQRFTAMGVRVIEGHARFTDPDTVAVGDVAIRARRTVLATGSRPATPAIAGLDRVPFLTNETIFGLAATPQHLIVLGGGPSGVELAQAYRRLGAPVTVLEAQPRLLAREDPEMAAAIERALLRDGVDLRLGVAVERVEPLELGVALFLRQNGTAERVTGSHLLVAAGRRAVTDGLGLEAAGIAVDAGGILVDAGLRTANRRVYAVGDCAGGAAAGYRFTHVSNYHAGLVIRSALFRLPVKIDTAAIPRVTYTDPELAAVGLSEAEARARHRAIRVLRFPFSENDRAQAERRTAGHLKAVVTARGRILGCAVAGPHAGELIMPWVLALSRGLRIQDLAGLVFPYPTFSEVTKRAAVEFLRPSAQSRVLRGIVGLVRRFG